MKKPYKILTVDDSAFTRKVIASYLAHEDFEVFAADCAEQALQALPGIEPDLIVLDINMPGMGGVGFLKHIATVDGRLPYPVLVLTARSAMADFFSTLEVAGFIPKPCTEQDFVAKVRDILAHQARPARGRQGPAKILLAEQEPGLRQELAAAFQADGYELQVAGSGPETIEKAAVFKPDAIVMREILQGLNGSAAAQMLHAMPGTAEVPIILYDEPLAREARIRLEEKTANCVARVVAGTSAQALLHAIQAVLA